MIQFVPPDGWVRTTLGTITRLRRERVEARNARGRSYVGLEHVQRDTGRLLSFGEGNVRSDKAAFEWGDVLYARLRPNLAKVWRATTDGVCSTEFLVMRRLRGIDPDFLALRLLTDDFIAFASSSTGSALYPRVAYEAIAAFELYLPPLAEQVRIARQVRTAFERLDVARDELTAARERADA